MSEAVVLKVTGMKCGGCESNVTDKLTALPGVIAVKAENKEDRVSIEFDPVQTNVQAIEQVITAAGFEVG